MPQIQGTFMPGGQKDEPVFNHRFHRLKKNEETNEHKWAQINPQIILKIISGKFVVIRVKKNYTRNKKSV